MSDRIHLDIPASAADRERREEIRKLAREIADGSIIMNAVARFVEQIVSETRDAAIETLVRDAELAAKTAERMIRSWQERADAAEAELRAAAVVIDALRDRQEATNAAAEAEAARLREAVEYARSSARIDADEIDRLEAEAARLREALTLIAKQKLAGERDYDVGGDYEFAYASCVEVARAALSPAPQGGE
jgi:uncharacterized membrane protein